jgi:transcriptional regulator with XRE-family HTH domain
MVDKNVGFLGVANRLRLALDLPSEAQLAERLGMKQSAWSTRKTRDQLPIKEIDALISAEGLNPEFIYKGDGSVHLDVDNESWSNGFQKRIEQSIGLATYMELLIREGHTKTTLKAVLAGKQEPTSKLLRDMRRCLQLDMNWLICGDIDTALNKEERAVVDSYRRATKEGKTTIAQVASIAPKGKTK